MDVDLADTPIEELEAISPKSNRRATAGMRLSSDVPSPMSGT